MLSRSVHPSDPITDNCEEPITKPLGDPKCITSDELRLLQNPDYLHGKQFLLLADSNDTQPTIFEVIGFTRKRDKTVTFEVLFEDSVDPIIMDEKEMMNMLGDSLYFPA